MLVVLPVTLSAQTEAWPQVSRSLDRMIWYSDDRPTTKAMVYFDLHDDNGVEGDGKAAGFWMLEFEVSNKQWLEFLDDTYYPPPHATADMEGLYAWHQIHAWRGRSYPPGMGGHPVFSISPSDAERFCEWRSRKTGFLHRLPLEREWEIASGGVDYPWGDGVSALKSVPIGRHMQVGPDPFYSFTHDVTPEGVKFLLGNVSEFVYADIDARSIVTRGSAYDTPTRQASMKYRRPVASIESKLRNAGFRYVIPVTADGRLTEYP